MYNEAIEKQQQNKRQSHTENVTDPGATSQLEISKLKVDNTMLVKSHAKVL